MHRFLTLQHVWENPKGYIGELLEEYGIAYDVVNVEAEPIPDPTAYTAVIAFGGSQHVYDDDKHPYFVQEKELLRTVVEREIPFLGICLGCQLLADVLGGKVRLHTMAEIGFFDVQITAEGESDPLYANLPGYQKVFHWHEDTFDLPAGAGLLATSENTENQAFRYGRCAYGLQYHIELNPEILNLWLHHPSIKPDVIKTLGIDTYNTLISELPVHYEIYQRHTRIMFENFLKICGLISGE